MNTRHVQYCLEWSRELPTFCGVDIGRALGYELVQFLNHSYLEGRLG